MQQSILILGSGLIGKAIAADLCHDYNVTCADYQQEALHEISSRYNVKTDLIDVRNAQALAKLVASFDLIIIAVPGFLGYQTLKIVIEAGKNLVDISFFPEDPFSLNELAIKQGVTAIVDCGVAPGLCNIWAGYQNTRMKMLGYECLVGGLPVVRTRPFEYKAVFSPADVIEEYTRPARYIENGKQVVREALSDVEQVQIPGVDTLEAFNTDGLRSLAYTMPHVPDMKEKTLRYPGHADLMRVFRDAGFFDKQMISLQQTDISPLSFTSKLLFSNWKLMPGEEDFTIMRVTIRGENENSESISVQYTLYDRYDTKSNLTSMARTTGFTCTAAARLLLNDIFQRKGICPPEFIGSDPQSYAFVHKSLAKRNVQIKEQTFSQSEHKIII
ncbi:MAG: saccharopine dehydrogenase NADP-binding domain-containing protein [Candidatus Competibacteraceae bacterium]|nr:saccharopine dehydrogenase NADP-binding domain-containing protein [Candidatus Competibacteraceae bacterium]